MKNQQRHALLSVYASLGFESEDAPRSRFYERVNHQLGDMGSVKRHRAAAINEIASEVSEALQQLASKERKHDQSLGRVLDVEIIELLTSLAKHNFSNDDQGRDAFKKNEALFAIASRIGRHDNLSKRGLLEAAFRAAHGDTAPGPAASGLEANPPTVAEQVRNQAARIAGVEAHQAITIEPGLHCQGRLIPVTVPGQGGEYATYLRTKVCVTTDDLAEAGFQPTAGFAADLFSVRTWKDRHDFWCSMDPLSWPGDLNAPANVLAREMIDARPTQPGLTYDVVLEGEGPTLINEKVGNCPNGSFPNTQLLFSDSRLIRSGHPSQYFLEYRLVPGASEALGIDDGTIQVVEDQGVICVTITKTVYFFEGESTSQGEIIAEYACASGWGEQTRAFLFGAPGTYAD